MFSEQTDTVADRSANRLEVSVGNEAFEPGWTQVLLDSSGLLHVLSKLEGSDDRRVEAKLEHEHATEMIQAARRSGTGAREGKRYGLPDEPRYHFEIGEGDMGQSFDVWRSDLPQHPALNRTVRTLQEVINEHTEGDIVL